MLEINNLIKLYEYRNNITLQFEASIDFLNENNTSGIRLALIKYDCIFGKSNYNSIQNELA